VGRIPEETIEAIRSRIDIVDLIGRYVALKQTGRSFKGLCPFHGEKTPSFHVHPERQIFHCFGCGAGGNAFAFLIKHENLTFPEAVRSLGAQCGVEVPENDGDAGETGALRRMREASAAAQVHYRAELIGAAGEGARAYLAGRGIDLATAERYGIGFAPDRWDALARALADKRIPASLAERAGLLAARQSGGHYDRLRGRVTFPIQDVRGDVIAFGGRALPQADPPIGRNDRKDQEPKYLNTPESPLFRKREAFYGLPEALEAIRRSERAIVVEGYFDRIALARAGMAESLATCGTALTPEHARQLRRRTRTVVLLFDGDDAGQRAMERSLAILLPEGLRVRAALLPPKDDPDSLLARAGADALRAVVDGAVPALEAVIRRAAARGVATPWEKSDAVADVVPLLALIADPIERGEYVRQLAMRVAVREDEIHAALKRASAERRGAPAAEKVEPAPARPTRALEGTEQRWVSELVQLLIEQPKHVHALDPVEIAELVPNESWRALVVGVIELADADGAVDVAALCERLDAAAAARLRELAVTERDPLEPAKAAAALGDIVERLRSRRRKEQAREIRMRIADGTGDLAEMKPLLEQRKAAQGLSSDSPVPSPR
jgi:DNA primase